jgi:hypothetical protein
MMEALGDFHAEPPDGGWNSSDFQWDPYRLEVALAAQDPAIAVDGENRADRSNVLAMYDPFYRPDVDVMGALSLEGEAQIQNEGPGAPPLLWDQQAPPHKAQKQLPRGPMNCQVKAGG